MENCFKRENNIGLEENCSEICFETKCFEEHHIATSNQSLFGENIWRQKTLPLDTEIRTKTDHQPLLSITEGVRRMNVSENIWMINSHDIEPGL